MGYNHSYNFTFLIADSPPPYATDIKDLDIPPNYDTTAAQDEFDGLTPEEIAAYEEGIALVLGDTNLDDSLQKSAQDAVQACTNIDDMFVSLTATIVGFDTYYHVKLESDLGEVQTVYRTTLDDSRRLALDIAHYAERYDDVILPMCADKDLTIEMRQAKIQKFIDDAHEIEKKSYALATRFENLKTEFATFVGKFSAWATQQVEEDNERIKHLQQEIRDLQKEIESLDLTLNLIYAGLGVTLPVTAIIATLSGPFAPLVMAAGCIAAGLELTSVVGLTIAKNNKQDEMNEKNTAVKQLQRQVQTIQATQTELEDAQTGDLKLFNDNVKTLVATWQTARDDARNVQTWLKDGAEDADVPKYMMMSIGKSVGAYRTMAAYLKGYADGVIHISK